MLALSTAAEKHQPQRQRADSSLSFVCLFPAWEESHGAMRRSVICILHTAYAQLYNRCVAPPRGLKSPPEKRVCLSLLVHAGITVLRYPALYQHKSFGHCVFVGMITGLLRLNRFNSDGS